MQQRQKAPPTPCKTQAPAQSQPAKSTPVVIDERALRQIAGGVQAPNGSW